MDALRVRLRPRRVLRSLLRRSRAAQARVRVTVARKSDTVSFLVKERLAKFSGRRRMHWSIKISAPDDETAVVWGDLYFARDLAAPLRALGHDVRIDYINTRHRPTATYRDDVVIHLRGLFETPAVDGAVNILWVVSHPELVSDRELTAGYDIVFAASETWAAAAAARTGLDVRPLLQATNPARFHPGDTDQELAARVLFVGKTRNNFRPIVRDALAVGVEPAIYGDGWEAFVPERLIRAQFLANERVPDAYRSAEVVLNDHWEDMRADGFLSNRLFDATASGAYVVTDDVPGVDAIFGSSVAVYRTPEDLARLLAPSAVRPTRAELRANASRIAERNSFDARAATLLAAVDDEQNRR